MNGPYAATGHYRASDIGEHGQPVRHAVISPRGFIVLDDRSSWDAAMKAASDLERGIHKIDHDRDMQRAAWRQAA